MRYLSAGAGAGLEPGNVGFDNLVIALNAEDQGHVYVAALTDHLADSGHPRFGGGYLHHQVGHVDLLVESAGVFYGAFGVVGQPGRNLEGHKAVTGAALIVKRVEYLQGGSDVRGRHFPEGLLDGAAFDESGEIGRVSVTAGHRFLEDGGIGGDAADAIVDQVGEAPVANGVA